MIKVHRGYRGRGAPIYQVPEVMYRKCDHCVFHPDLVAGEMCIHAARLRCLDNRSICVTDLDTYKVARVTYALVGDSNGDE